MITIRMIDGDIDRWWDHEYTDYLVTPENLFVVRWELQWIGIYPLQNVESIVIKRGD